jgi:hypothetical protein
MEPELLSLHQAATRKGVPPHTLREAIEAGDLPAIHRGGWLVRASDLERWRPHWKTAAGSDSTDPEAAECLRVGVTPK